jgi:hypothetical protein
MEFIVYFEEFHNIFAERITNFTDLRIAVVCKYIFSLSLPCTSNLKLK